MVNSTWTKGHIDQLWRTKSEIVYPPCDTERLNALPLKGRKSMIISVAQFRPEKDHSLQLKALATLFKKYPQWKTTHPVELVLMGSSRNEGDAKRIDGLRKEAVDLGIHVSIRKTKPCVIVCADRMDAGLCSFWNQCLIRSFGFQPWHVENRSSYHVEWTFWYWCGWIHGCWIDTCRS